MINAYRLSLLALLATQNAFASPFALEDRTTGPVRLGRAKTFAVCAATTITNSGNTVIMGDMGTCPGTSITAFPPGICTGTISRGGTVACNCEADCLTAYNVAAGLPVTVQLTSSDLGGLTLAPGVFGFPTSAVTLTGNLTLDGNTNHKGQWVFEITTTFGVAANARVILINGAQACNVVFKVGTSATVGAGAIMNGNILAYTSIAAGEAASNKGIWCALNGAVTLIDNALKAQPTCTN